MTLNIVSVLSYKYNELFLIFKMGCEDVLDKANIALWVNQ